uniref:HAT C-terminal dimerisation domain-containing protein n=1 Tax=Vitis vinifera TaxID=29760 RepID=A5B0T0_VITVI|nr:hypothetical protein VITISV_014393 [Vitis vinifera]
MTLEGDEKIFMPSTGSNPAIGSTSTTNGSLTYRCIKRRNVDIKQQLLAVERKGYGKVQIGGFTFDQDISREKLTRVIILHKYPLSIVDCAGFRDFASSLQILFKMVSHNTIKDDIMKIFEFEKGKMSSYLEKLETRMAITTDMWTSNQKKGYMAITVHYIDEFVYVPPPHTKEVLFDVLLDWNMDRKLSTITVDNCSSNDDMINIILEKLSSSGSLLLNEKIFHMRCASHVLNLIVKEDLDVIRVEIEKFCESVAYWSATPSRVEKFEDAARQLRLPCNKKLCLDYFDVLSWWKTNGIKYPTLQMIIRDIYVILISIVASKSTFSTSGSASKRKKVVAPPRKEEKVDKKFVYISPMPLDAARIAIVGVGLLKNKGSITFNLFPGDGKQKREGPCVGTKGFWAPKVYFIGYNNGLSRYINKSVYIASNQIVAIPIPEPEPEPEPDPDPDPEPELALPRKHIWYGDGIINSFVNGNGRH